MRNIPAVSRPDHYLVFKMFNTLLRESFAVLCSRICIQLTSKHPGLTSQSMEVLILNGATQRELAIGHESQCKYFVGICRLF